MMPFLYIWITTLFPSQSIYGQDFLSLFIHIKQSHVTIKNKISESLWSIALISFKIFTACPFDLFTIAAEVNNISQ